MRTMSLMRVLAVLALLAGAAAAVDVAVHAGNTQVPEVTRETVQDIFLGRKATWADGSRIEIVVLKDGDAHTAFLKDQVGRTPSQFSFHWRNLLFTGRGRMPTVVADEAAMAVYLRQHPNAIGYLAGSVDDAGLRRIPVR